MAIVVFLSFLSLSLMSLSPGPALSADTIRLPGLGHGNMRAAVDIARAPWNALVRVQTNLAGRCTGALVAPRMVLTAAHCVHNTRTRRLFPPSSLHVLFGYDRGNWTEHRRVRSVVTGDGFDGTRPSDTLHADWALLELDAEPGTGAIPLPLATARPGPGTPAAVAGFSQDRTHVLMADRDCRVRAVMERRGVPLLAHDCAGTRGTSGAPLLVQDGDRWAIAGVHVAATPGHSLAVGVESFSSSVANR